MKVFRYFLIAVVAWCVLVFAYGIAAYPDAPIKPGDHDSYTGKTHRQHTEAHYHAFLRWQTLLLTCWPFGLVAGFILPKLETKKPVPSPSAPADRE